jgi:predicted Rossmann fold flavoprotein
MNKKEKDIIIIGGGAAGFFAAASSAENNPGNNVIILEKGNTVLGKVKISGGGRCNVTNACSDPAELIKYYPRGGKELLSPFHRFSSLNTIEWFVKHDVKLKTEPDGRMFPISDDSQTIVDCLKNTAQKAGVKVLKQNGVIKINKAFGRDWTITTPEKEFHANAVIICSGSSGSVWKMLESIGHTIEPPVPSLFTFNINDKRIKDIPGISVKNTDIKIEGAKLKSSGPLLITHWGMSGPGILKISAWGAKDLHKMDYKFKLSINWLPGMNQESAKEKLISIKNNNLTRRIYSFSPLDIPLRLWERLLEYINLDNDLKWNNVSQNLITNLASELTNSSFNVSGKSTFKEEFVTCGGVRRSEIDFKNMESKLNKGLFFAGEVIDIDAVTGGFNFQAAWTTGWIAGISASVI